MKSNSSNHLSLSVSDFFLPGKSPSVLSRFIVFLLAFWAFMPSALAVNKTSTGNGNWNSASSWSPSGAPATGDAVTIAAGHTIVVNTNTNALASLTISGTLTIGNNSSDRTITVSGNITINSGGVFNTAGNGGNVLVVRGNLTNNGVFDMNISSADARVDFTGNANQYVTGTGSVTDFSDLVLTNTGAANNNILEISSTNFTADNGFLSVNDGIFKLSGTFNISNTFFGSSSPTINSDEGFWLNNPNATVTAQSGTTSLYGMLIISDGTYNIGTGSSHRLVYYNGASFTMSAGELNVSGAFYGNGANDAITYNQSGGTVSVCSVGNSSWFDASFEIYEETSSFTMSGGHIKLERQATFTTDYLNNSTNANITGGTIQAGGLLTLLSSVFWINSTPPIYNLEVNALNSPYFQLRNNTQVINNVMIGGILDASSQNASLTVGGNWTNNGVYLPASSSPVIFSGTSPQQIGGTVSTTFNNVEFNNTGGGVTLNRTVNVATSATFTAGIVTSSATSPLVFLDNATATGANNNSSNPSYVHGPVRKVGNDAFTFPVGKSGSGYHPCGISAPLLITDVFTAEYIRSSGSQLGNITSPGLYNVSNCDYWDIERTLGISNVNVTLSWNGTSNCNSSAYVTSLSSLVVAHFNGTSWDTHGASSSSGSSSAGTVTRNACTSFSVFALGSTSAASNPLPVKFSNVRAFASGSGNRVEWTNETESDVLEYIIEKAGLNQEFESIGRQAPAINNGGRSAYHFYDVDVHPDQAAWYRVKVIETTGSFKYSAIVKVARKNSLSPALSVFPNPLSGREMSFQLNNADAGIYTIAVYDQSGKIITSQAMNHRGGSTSQSINLPNNCSAGIYIIKVAGHNIGFSEKLIIR